MNNKPKIIAVTGPTASGKSALALELAKRHNGEIISCDSMQVYKKMNIGTAKPTAEEMAQVRHHMIDILEPTDNFSSEDYVALASRAVFDCTSRGKLPIICGGTGLYLDSLLRGGNSAFVSDTSEIRAELTLRAKNGGIGKLYDILKAIDPESAENIHPNNEKRVIRALEIYYACGKTKSEFDRLSRESESPYDATVAYLCFYDRELLYRRIETRVDIMLSEGLIEETNSLLAQGVFELNRTAAQAIGYKELFDCIDGKESIQEASDKLKTATRRYAKRQLTWFRAKEYAQPLYADDDSGMKTFEEIVNNAEKLFSI